MVHQAHSVDCLNCHNDVVTPFCPNFDNTLILVEHSKPYFLTVIASSETLNRGMIPPIPTLQDYGISPSHGFLPMELPLDVLPDPYYGQWEAIASNLQALILSKRLRGVIDRLPILSTVHLQHPAEWRRAYSILSFMTHAYIWGGDRPEEVGYIPITSDRSLIVVLESTTAYLDPIS